MQQIEDLGAEKDVERVDRQEVVEVSHCSGSLVESDLSLINQRSHPPSEMISGMNVEKCDWESFFPPGKNAAHRDRIFEHAPWSVIRSLKRTPGNGPGFPGLEPLHDVWKTWRSS